MPIKRGVCRDLVRVNITARAHQYTMKFKRPREPFYSIFDRILSSYIDNDVSDLQLLYDDTVKQCKMWKERAETAEKRVQMTLL